MIKKRSWILEGVHGRNWVGEGEEQEWCRCSAVQSHVSRPHHNLIVGLEWWWWRWWWRQYSVWSTIKTNKQIGQPTASQHLLPLLIGHENVRLKFASEAPMELTARTVTVCACSAHRKVRLVWSPASSDHVPLWAVRCWTTYLLTLHRESFFIRGWSKHKNLLAHGPQHLHQLSS